VSPSRSILRGVPDSVRDSLASKLDSFGRALIRELQYLWRKRPAGQSLEEFSRTVVEKLRLPPLAAKQLQAELFEAEAELATAWDHYFQGVLDEPVKAGDLERLTSAHAIDFPKIQEEVREIVRQESLRAARADMGFNALRRRLIDRGVGTASAQTLANTSLAQFSNSYMFDVARQGGIERFKYDGPLNPNTRAFCRKHLGKVYAYAEILTMDNGQGIPVVSSCGGYNCRHYWTPVPTERKAEG